MPDIGATLREARMRQRLDISDVEASTKIRAKYLRALENEEWDLLPGPTFVKTFLRTYAETLGLDARLVLEEYKLRYERLSDHELQPIAPPSRRETRQRRAPGWGRDVLVAVLVVGLVGLLIVLGGDDGDGEPPRPAATTTATTARTTAENDRRGGAEEEAQRPARPSRARLRLEATGEVYVCLKAGDRVLIRERVLTADTPARTYRARSFRLLLGNNAVTLRINGRRAAVPASSDPIAYRITARGRTRIPASPASSFCS